MENLKIKIRLGDRAVELGDVIPEIRKNTYKTVEEWIKTLPLFKELDLDLQPILFAARHFRTFQDVVVLGTGGSCLSGKMYAALKANATMENEEEASGPCMHFIDNVDAATWNRVVAPLNPQMTGVIAISKSGNTTETLCQTFMAIEQWKGTSLSDHFLFVADPGESALREISAYHAIPCLDHPVGIGGRFSGFSVVGLLPALIAGVDVREVLAGAKDVIQAFLKAGEKDNMILKNAFIFDELFLSDVCQLVLFCYGDRLRPFAEWYRQLFAESLGKTRPTDPETQQAMRNVLDMFKKESKEEEDGEDEEEDDLDFDSFCEKNEHFGMTPIIAMGTVDQHSQLQLYMEGPDDKFYTFFTLGDHPATKPLDVKGITNPIARALNGHTMAELMLAHQKATQQGLAAQKNTRTIHISKWDERSLGQLMMISILEVLALAAVWGVDPFNQPGVQAGKDQVLALMRG